MSNELKMERKMILYQLFALGWSERKISENTGIHRKTVHRYRLIYQQTQLEEELRKSSTDSVINQTETTEEIIQSVPPEVPTGKMVHFEVPTGSKKNLPEVSKSKVSIYDETIREKLEGGQSARSIYQDLYLEENYRGSYDSVKRYVRRLKKTHPKLYARIETPPGEEAQVDFGQGAPTLKNGRYRRPWLFVMKLSNSRATYQEVVWNQDVETFLRCHEHAFEYFGGVVKTIKIDNLKAGVLKAHLYEPTLNPNYLAFSKHHGFVILPCRVARPQDKGKVESGVKYVQDNALTNKRFDSLEAQNRYLRKWNEIWAMQRIHGTTKRQVRQMYEAEKPYLQKLAAQPYAFFQIGKRKVNVMDSHVQVEGAYYPVAPQYMGKTVTVHYNREWVKIYYQTELIQHLSRIEKGTFHPDRSCLPAEKTYSQQQHYHRQLRKCKLLGESVHQWALACEQQRGAQAFRAIQGIISLKKRYSYDILNRACAMSLRENLLNYHAVHLNAEKLCYARENQREILLQEDEVIRTPQSYAQILEGED